MRNDLERFCAKSLERAGLQFEYEKTFELFPAFSTNIVCIERPGKSRYLKQKADKYLNMKFSPDFVGDGWIVETKGLRRPDFDLRWKIFKYQNRDKDWILLTPKSQKDVVASIIIIEQWKNGKRTWSNEELLSIYQNIKLFTKKRAKSTASKTKKRPPRAIRKRGLDGIQDRISSGLSTDLS